MAITLNPESDIASFVNPIFEGALLVAREQNIMLAPNMVRMFGDRTGLAARKNSQYGGATMNQIAETDDLVSQSFTPSVISTLTPLEFGAQYMLTDSRIETDPFTVKQDASNDLGEAMATKMETDMVALFSSFTGGTVGAAAGTTVITWGHLFAAEAILKAQKAPYPYICVLHPYQWQVLAKAASVASSSATNAADSLKEAVNSMFFVKQVGGVSIFVSSNISIGTGAHAGMWSRDALAFDLRRAPRLEAERKASRRAWELNMTSVYAAGVWRPLFGVDMLFDATTPTN